MGKLIESWGHHELTSRFGSVVVTDPEAMTSAYIGPFCEESLTRPETIMEAVKKSGVRALVSAGWGGLGGADVPDEVFILEGKLA